MHVFLILHKLCLNYLQQLVLGTETRTMTPQYIKLHMNCRHGNWYDPPFRDPPTRKSTYGSIIKVSITLGQITISFARKNNYYEIDYFKFWLISGKLVSD